MKKNKKNKLGILGGTFDPAHIGHIKISKEAKNRFGLKKVIWAVTKKNPFKNKSSLTLKKRISYAKKINLKNKFIQVVFLVIGGFITTYLALNTVSSGEGVIEGLKVIYSLFLRMSITMQKSLN